MADSLTAGVEYRDEEWPHGLRCGECSHLFTDGERYSERLDGLVDEYPMVLIVCMSCALEPASDDLRSKE